MASKRARSSASDWASAPAARFWSVISAANSIRSDFEVMTLRVEYEDHIGHGLEEGPQLRLRLGQRSGSALLVGDIGCQQHHAADAPSGVPQGTRGNAHFDQAAILMGVSGLNTAECLPAQHRLKHGLKGRAILFPGQWEGAAQSLAAAPAEDALCRRIPHLDVAATVQGDDRHRRGG